MKDNHIVYFEEINGTHGYLVGGKGANLGEMIQAGLPVPHGFCITTKAYAEFIENNRIGIVISDLLKGITDQNVRELANEIRRVILDGAIDVSLTKAIKHALRTFSEDAFYSVRSSATAEDLDFASFAGQQDTYLNVKGEASIIEHVKKCWASLYTERAVLYRIQNDIDHKDVLMSVVIQKMIKSEESGIMFTADPVSGHRGIIAIDAGFGLGEALVSGLVSPDIYKVDKAHNTIMDKKVSYKKIAIRPLNDGGTITKELSQLEGNKQVLTDATILELAHIGTQIENHYGRPQDIEWCTENGQIYIVQSRAITSLYPLPEPRPTDSRRHYYISVSHMQSMLDEVSPLGLDMLPLIFNVNPKPLGDYQSKVIISAGGRFYTDFTEILTIKGVSSRIISAFTHVDALMSSCLESLYNQGAFDQPTKLKKRDILKSLWRFKSVPFRVFCLIIFKDSSKIVGVMDQNIKRISSDIEMKIRNQDNPTARIECIYKELELITRFTKYIIPYLVTGIMSLKLLEKIALRNFGNKDLIARMTKGLKGNVTTEMGLLLGDIADDIRLSDELKTAFYSDDFRSLLDRVDQLQGFDDFKVKLSNFFDVYGCRANGEIDIAKVRWIENPEQVVRSIRSMIEGMSHRQHRDEFDKTEKEAEAACREFVRLYTEDKGYIKGKLVKHLVGVMRNALPVREHHKFMLISVFGVAKATLLSDAKMLVEKGVIEAADEIFWLRLTELYQVTREPRDCNELIQSRKETYKHYGNLKPPRVITSDGEIIHGTYDSDEFPEGALVGIGASSGTYEGIARVISDPAKESINKGEILVARFTDPGWTPLFLNASGLVMEIGGQLTHGTVVAREYGMPAVVGVEDATVNIKTGDRIRIDGNAGYIIILEEMK